MTALPTGIQDCPVAEEISAEFPGLGLLTCGVNAAKASSPGVVQELDALSQRLNGPKAVHAAAEPVAAAYRALRVGLGMDPDADGASLESIIKRRLIEGGYRSQGQPIDAITITTVETGVPIQALSAHGANWSLGIDPVTQAVALFSDSQALTTLFSESTSSSAVQKDSGSTQLLAVVAPGVLPEVVALALDRARDLAQS